MRLREQLEALRKIDLASEQANVEPMNRNRTSTKLARLNLTAVEKEAAAIKTEFRREDEALVRSGRADEVLWRNVSPLGIKRGTRTRLVGFGGVCFED